MPIDTPSLGRRSSSTTINTARNRCVLVSDAPPDIQRHEPFLAGFAALHRAMRRDTRRLPLAIARLEHPADAARLVRWYTAFHAAIDHHHRREDDLVWPELQRRDSSFGHHAEELTDDHHVLEAALTDVGTGLRDLAAGRREVRASVVMAAEGLATILHDHLAREEAAAFGRIGHAFTAEEYAALEGQMTHGMSIRELAFLGPWTFDELDPNVAADMLELLPAPMRLLVRTVFTRRYQRLAAPLLAVAS
jgi:hypothetical protein